MKKVLLVNLLATALLLSGCNVSNENSVLTSSEEEQQSSSVLTSDSSSSSAVSSSSEEKHEPQPQPEPEPEPEPEPDDDYTVMIYLCGSDLESWSGYAYKDLKEIMAVKNMPDNVNIIFQTGGASSWSYASGISAGEIGRYEIRDQKISKLDALEDANMGASNTFRDFIKWGVSEYPAKKTGVIMWDHGGGMAGCCYDENYGNYLTPSEQDKALSEAFKDLGLTKKLEWIGYDCCLMAVQDIAENNSEYFNYFVASQETEAGDGWDYDNWVDNLFADSKISTETLLTEICRSFVADNSREATLSVLDLSKMPAYKQAWEDLTVSLNINLSSKMVTLKNTVLKTSKFADGDCELFDVVDFINYGKTDYPDQEEQWDALEDAFVDLLVSNKTTSDYKSKAHGLCFFYPSAAKYKKTVYSETATSFAEWRNICTKYGSWKR